MTPADLIPWLVARTVATPAGCWEWLGACGGGGDGRPRRPQCKYRGRVVYVARLVLATQLGRPLRRGMLATHRCDNPRCVHPNHLQEGDYSSNLQEAWDRGRRAPTTFAA